MKAKLLLSVLIFSATTVFAQFEQAKLNYSYGALEPYIDSATMYIHYNNHHATYTKNLNKSLEGYPDLQKKDITELLKNLSTLPAAIQTSVRNNGGGFYNHNLFWSMLAPAGTTPVSDNMKKVISRDFGSFDTFKSAFESEAASRFGSGWVWLVKTPDNKLSIISTPNQDNPVSTMDAKIILALDVWEHAYYLHYQSKRADYAKAFWHVVNWKEVERLYNEK